MHVVKVILGKEYLQNDFSYISSKILSHYLQFEHNIKYTQINHWNYGSRCSRNLLSNNMEWKYSWL